MAVTPSKMIALGSKASQFTLLNVISEKNFIFDESKKEKGTLIMFICNHCPFVIHVNNGLVKLANDYQPKGVNFIAINSNDVANYPQDNPELMKQVAINLKYPFPYLYDETQEVAKVYHAECTPDFFLFDAENKLVYRGQLDDSRPNNGKSVTGKDIRIALNLLLERKSIPKENQLPSIGCNIKWKK